MTFFCLISKQYDGNIRTIKKYVVLLLNAILSPNLLIYTSNDFDLFEFKILNTFPDI